MNQKRSWPGVPNRYSTRCLPMVIRPKSIATVVVVLPPTPDRSSCPTLTLVSASSVCSGRTSLIAPTSVVLPAPNPPATRILKTASGSLAGPSEGAKPMQYLPEQVGGGRFTGRVLLPHDGDPALKNQVSEQDPDDAQGKRGVRGDVGHCDGRPAQAEDPAVLGAERHRVAGLRGLAGGHDERDDVEHLAVGWLRPAPGHRVGAHDRAGVLGAPLAARIHGRLSPRRCWRPGI